MKIHISYGNRWFSFRYEFSDYVFFKTVYGKDEFRCQEYRNIQGLCKLTQGEWE